MSKKVRQRFRQTRSKLAQLPSPPNRQKNTGLLLYKSLQNLGNYTFAAEFEADDFLQKVITLQKRPDATKINRLTAPWREKFKCFSLDSNDFFYMDERLVIPKVLPPIILRSLNYGHPGRDSMLATVSNV